jgi:pilus assembly protein FimV
VRNLGLIITFLLAIIALPTSSFALGLGQIEVKSFLNQPLNAEIEVVSTRAGEIDDLLVTLASRDAFKRAGLSRPRHLSELKFAVKKAEDGNSAVILVTTKSAIKEPFLSFLVEADWSKGKVLREFTVLLDPPYYAEIPAPAETVSQSTAPQSTAPQTVTPRSTISQSTTPTTSTVTPIVDEVVAIEPVTPIAIVAPSTAGDEQTITEPIALSDTSDADAEYLATDLIAEESVTLVIGDLLVEKGDTLWSFASRFEDSGHSMGQIMLAIQRTNPEAFGAGNINHLKIGAVLRAPSAEQLDRLGQRDAQAEVLEQHGLWNDYVMRVTGATPVAMAGDGGDVGSDSGDSSDDSMSDLSLLAPGDGSSDAAGLQGDGGDANQLSRDLAIAEEELDASRLENSELESRIAELEATLSKVQELQKMVQIEDDSLAQLQADQAAKAAAQADAAEQAAAEQAAAEAAAEQVAVEAATEQALADAISREEEALLEKLLVEEAKSESATEQQASVTPPAPVIVTEPMQQSDSMLDGIIPPEFLQMLTGVLDLVPSMDNILTDPVMLGALGGVVLLILVLIFVKRRKGSDPDDDGDGNDDDTIADGSEDELTLVVEEKEEELTPIHTGSESSKDESSTSLSGAEDAQDDEVDISPVPSTPQAEIAESMAQESEPQEQDDTLNEVDVYLAYGLYDNAEDLLNQNLEANPDRADYRSKLLDTYFATKDAAKFLLQAEKLKAMGAAADPYWARVQAMGYSLVPDNELFSGGKDSDISADDFGIAKPEAADLDIGASEDNTNFSTTDFNLGEDAEELEELKEIEETQNFIETVIRQDEDDGEIEATQKLPNLDDLPGLDDEISVDSDDSLDAEVSSSESGELEFALDDNVDASDAESDDDDAMDFGLPDDLGTDAGDSVADEEAEEEAEPDELTMKINMEETLQFDGNLPADQEIEDAKNADDTNIIDMVDGFVDDVTAFELDQLDDDAGSSQEPGSIDDNMDDTFLEDNQFDEGDVVELDESGIDLSADGFDLDEDSIDLDTADDDDDFEATAFMSAVDQDVGDSDDEISLGLDDDPEIDVDPDGSPAKTDTFAPGDFDDPEELAVSESDIGDISFDDIDDLVLPDDVDEVGTKLDLARAFIDMGDAEGARSSLDEVLVEGDEDQKAEATGMLKHL